MFSIIIGLCIISLLSFFIDYTEMNDPGDQALDDDNLENDEPEDIYITMDPHVFIPPPDTYKHKRTEDK